VLSLVISALMMLATGLVTLAVVPATATAAPGITYIAAPTPTPTGVLPDVTVHSTTAPMTNPAHTGVTRTANCPTGSLVGGGGYLRNATNPSTLPTNGLVLGGTNPSTGASPVDQPVADAATDPSNWMAIANFTGVAESGDQATAFAMCATNGPTHTVVKSTTTTGANTTQQVNPPTLTIATCPTGTTLIGGGAVTNTPDQTNDGTTVGNNGNLKPLGSYPSDTSGAPTADGSTTATSWSAYGSAGITFPTDTVTALAVCTSDPIQPITVARVDLSGPDAQPGTTTTIATAQCPTGTRMLGGGYKTDQTVNGTSGLQPQQGFHMRGSYPSTGPGTLPTEVTDTTTNPSAWTALLQAGGQNLPGGNSMQLHTFAMCFNVPTVPPTPNPSPSPSPTPLPTDTPAPTPAPTDTPSPTPHPLQSNGPIVFQSARTASGKYAIFAMDPDGGNVVQLTHNDTANDTGPAISGDGQHIVFNSDRDGNVEIYSMNPDGSSQTRLTNNPASDQEPQFNFDGSKIVFWSNRDATPPGNRSGNEIYTMNADGTNVVRLTTDQSNNRRPTWSPDGTKIAWSNDVGRNPGDSQIWTMNADGSNHVQLTFDQPLHHSTEPAFSPDGTHIAFSSTRNGGDINPEIFVMGADGSNQTQLTTVPKNSQSSWSPDGSKIVFNSTRDAGNVELYVMNSADGSGQTNITQNPAVDTHGTWAPTGAPIPTPTPTPVPTDTPAPTPTPVVTPTPTPIPPTPTPTPVVTPTPRPTLSPSPSPTPAPVTATTTTLSVIQVPLPFGLGGIAIPTAHVAPPNAPGTVQFKDGTTNLGGPVPVTGGLAIGPIRILGTGTHSLTAVFTPTTPTTFKPSTSNTVTVKF
jgi:TolB protein